MQLDEPESPDTPPHSGVPELRSGWLYSLARVGAIAGGFVFGLLIVMLVVTIVSRKLFTWQVPGDVELVEMGAAMAAAPFFAWCHLVRGEVKVDFATNHLPKGWIALLDGLGSLLIALYGALATWRTGALAISSFRNAEMSAVLGWPIWVAQALMVPGFALLAIVGLHEAVRAFAHCGGGSRSVAARLEASK